ncbi:restriction endonuclease type II-like protein [Fomitopsis serialis]|uniref:restriction endonuclease type II-like protein n=1 Tax=Fomitopsis serialis TaxID=139415 RepID=UPI002008A899|nr:restriction endonuclease type II-like protein [Neoantrodia serialis]KAH9935459.1 restriction endonuclease type II-like protein [Neoantrodia serialis]
MSSTANRPAAAAAAPKPPVVVPGTGNNIIVNPCQRGNPILEAVRNVGKEFGDIVADYQVGRTTGVLFLSLRYHRLHPEYIHQRIERLGHAYTLRVLLLMCDVSEHQEPIRELTKMCLINTITVMVAWNAEEAGYYLSTYKQFENKPPDLIKERVDKTYDAMLRTALTSISKVNKTDVETLRTTFGSFADIARASSDQLQKLPGVGQVKAKRIQDAFRKPFRNNATSTLSSQLLATHLSQATVDKGKEKESSASNPSAAVSDLNSPSPPAAAPMQTIKDSSGPSADTAASSSTASLGRKRPPSPVWDIELDLNESDVEVDGPGPSKKTRTETNFGDPLFLQETP